VFVMNQCSFRELVQQGDLQQAEHVMISQYPNSVEIDRVHSVAICLEIGERLGGALTAPRLPPRLAELLDIFECHNVSFGIPAENEQK
jgi:hypothetical protein